MLAGVKEQKPRWQTFHADEVDRDLSDALGQSWVEKYFPPDAKRPPMPVMLVEDTCARLCAGFTWSMPIG